MSGQSRGMNREFCECSDQACLVRDSSGIVIYCEHWQRNFGLGVVGIVAMVIVTFLQKCVVCSLGQKKEGERAKEERTMTKTGP